MGIVDILQTDINHVGGVSGLWKVAQMAAVSGVSMAPHACEGPIGGLATLNREARSGIRTIGGESREVPVRRHASMARVFHEDGSVAEW